MYKNVSADVVESVIKAELFDIVKYGDKTSGREFNKYIYGLD